MLNNKEFYPTPKELIKRLLTRKSSFMGGMNFEYKLEGKILEPSAGKGDIAEYIKNNNRHAEIDLIEYDENLVNVLYGKGYNVVWRDFLTYETHKQYDAIVMNPPFSNGDEHLLKALEIAKSNITKTCSIYAIINAETIKNPFSNKRKELLNTLNNHNADIEFVESAFADAERRTNVEVALVRVDIKPKDVSKELYSSIIENLKSGVEEMTTELSTFIKKSELAEQLQEIPRLIKEYHELVKLIKHTHELNYKKERFVNYIEELNDIRLLFKENTVLLDEELDRVRSNYWRLILNTEEFANRLTTEAKNDLMKQIEMAGNLEINEDNVYMLLSAMLGNQSSMIEQSVVGIFDKVTQHSQRGEYTTNIHLYNGWYTNDAFKINSKIIYPISRGGFDWTAYGDTFDRLGYAIKDFIRDLDKAFQLFGKTEPFDKVGENEFENNVMRFKLFKKGTVHIWFKDLEKLDQINLIAGRHYNWLPTEEEVKENPKAKEYMEENFSTIKLLK